MPTTMASLANFRILLVVVLSAASLLPRSSADASFITETCRRTRHEGLCASVLQSTNASRTAATVQDLAVAALTSARRATLRAKLQALDLVYGGENGTALGLLLTQCDALYSSCLRASSKVMGIVSTKAPHDGAADAAAPLRAFPEKCGELFAARRIASPLEKVNREAEETLEVSYEIIRLLH
jgi:pectinesterase inhibitor-like protein